MIELEAIRKRVVELLDRGHTAGLEDREYTQILRQVDRLWPRLSRGRRRSPATSDSTRSTL